MSFFKNFIYIVAIGLAIGQTAYSQEYTYNVKNYITESGMETLLTGELQSLIDLCHEAGGAVTPFIYLEGTETKKVYLQNNKFTYLDVIFDHDQLFNIQELKEFNNIDPDR